MVLVLPSWCITWTSFIVNQIGIACAFMRMQLSVALIMDYMYYFLAKVNILESPQLQDFK